MSKTLARIMFTLVVLTALLVAAKCGYAQTPVSRGIKGDTLWIPRFRGEIEGFGRTQRYMDSSFVGVQAFIATPSQYIQFIPVGFFAKARLTGTDFAFVGGTSYMSAGKSEQIELGIGAGYSYRLTEPDTNRRRLDEQRCRSAGYENDLCVYTRGRPVLMVYGYDGASDMLASVEATFTQTSPLYANVFYDRVLCGDVWYSGYLLFPVIGNMQEGTSLGLMAERHLGVGPRLQINLGSMSSAFWVAPAYDAELPKGMHNATDWPDARRWKVAGGGKIVW